MTFGGRWDQIRSVPPWLILKSRERSRRGMLIPQVSIYLRHFAPKSLASDAFKGSVRRWVGLREIKAEIPPLSAYA